MKHLADIIKTRYKFYIVGYIIAYAIAIANKGTANIHMLFPLNAFSLIVGLLLGTLFYYSTQKTLIVSGALRSLKYIILLALITMALGFFNHWLATLGINAEPFMGF